MTREFTLGDMAMVIVDGAEERAVRVGGGPEPYWRFADGLIRPCADCTARPLVVLDPEDRSQAEAICDAIPWLGTAPNLVDDMQEALRSLIAEPEPEEPTGLGAVVRDGDGEVWLRADEEFKYPWFIAGASGCLPWSDLPRPLTVLSEGYTGAES